MMMQFKNKNLNPFGITNTSCASKYTRSGKFTKILLIGILTYLFVGTVFSQEQTIDNNYSEIIYFEADPFAYINKGYSLHLGYENWGMRFDLTKVKVDFPISFENAFYSTTAFDLKTNITGVKIDYIGNRTNWTRNAFVGLDLNYQKQSFLHRSTEQNKNLNTFNVGLRAGYKINIWKGLYITPWAAIWKNTAEIQTHQVGEDIISTKGWDWIATFHIGYAEKI